MKKVIVNGLGLLATLGVMASVAGCGGQAGAKKVAGVEADSVKKVTVKTSAATEEDVEQNAVFTSDIEAWQQNNIVSASSGLRIAKILVDVGSKVSRGQLLATMDPMQYNSETVRITTTRANYERIKKVHQAGGVSKQEVDQAETELKALEESYKITIENTQLRSPINGVVTARNAEPGDFPSQQLPILTIMQIDRLKVALSISEQYFPLVKKGMKAQISVDMYPDKVFEGEVSLIYPAIDPATKTFTIEVTVPNQSGELRPGMFSRTKLVFGTKRGVMIDDVAVQKQLGTNEKFVFVANGGAAERRVVTTGVQQGPKIEILSGVGAGEQVVVAGITRLMDGTGIEVKNE